MKALQTLRVLIQKLKNEEVKSLKKFINYDEKSLNSEKSKTYKLVSILLENKVQSSSEIQIALFGTTNYEAFNKLLNRLRDKIHEVILFDSNLEKTVASKRNLAIFDTRKKLIQSEVLFSRGMKEETQVFHKKIIKQAKQYEVYDVILEALYAQQRYLGFRLGSASYRKLNKEIDFYESGRIAAIKARQKFNSISSKINFSSSFEDYSVELNETISQLQIDFNSTKSSTIGYYYFILVIEKLQNENRLDEAQKNLFELKKLLEKNKAIFTKHRMGNTLINIANNELLMRDFSTALISASKADEFYLDAGGINLLVVNEIKFYSLYYQFKFAEAKLIAEEMYFGSRSANMSFFNSKSGFLLSCIKTINLEFEESNRLLQELSDIDLDREGWNISRRLLFIINNIELGLYDEVELLIQNLQKHIRRTSRKKLVRKRFMIIVQILVRLVNLNFDFKKVYDGRKKQLMLLASNDLDYRWIVKSPELIIFHIWFKNKALNMKNTEFSKYFFSEL